MSFYLSRNLIDWTEKYLSIVLVFCILALSLSYIYFIKSSVFNTIARGQDNKEASRLLIERSRLEDSYIALKSNINLDMAHSFGFKDDFSKVHFSSESTNVAGNLSLLGNEI